MLNNVLLVQLLVKLVPLQLPVNHVKKDSTYLVNNVQLPVQMEPTHPLLTENVTIVSQLVLLVVDQKILIVNLVMLHYSYTTNNVLNHVQKDSTLMPPPELANLVMLHVPFVMDSQMETVNLVRTDGILKEKLVLKNVVNNYMKMMTTTNVTHVILLVSLVMVVIMMIVLLVKNQDSNTSPLVSFLAQMASTETKKPEPATIVTIPVKPVMVEPTTTVYLVTKEDSYMKRNVLNHVQKDSSEMLTPIPVKNVKMSAKLVPTTSHVLLVTPQDSYTMEIVLTHVQKPSTEIPPPEPVNHVPPHVTIVLLPVKTNVLTVKLHTS